MGGLISERANKTKVRGLKGESLWYFHISGIVPRYVTLMLTHALYPSDWSLQCSVLVEFLK